MSVLSRLLVLGIVVGACRLATASPVIVDPGQGVFVFSGSGSSELSGITYAGGTSYYAESDNAPIIYPLNVTLNTSTAFVTGVTVGTGVTMNDNVGTALPNTPNKWDAEGIAYDPTTGKVWVSNESEPGIRRHDLTTGNTELSITPASAAQLNVFANTRTDFGFESLTRSPSGSVTWTANEESLTTDGPIATDTVGTAVRLQRFNSSMTPTGQWAYITDPAVGPLSPIPFSGVSDLAVLADGSLLVLERSLGLVSGNPLLRSRIYWVSANQFTPAADVSGISNLDTAPLGDLTGEPWLPPLTKTLLWQSTFPNSNFDGITLGPTLANGDIELLLISDNQNTALANQALYPLRLVVPEPGSLALAGIGAAMVSMLLVRRKSAARSTSP